MNRTEKNVQGGGSMHRPSRNTVKPVFRVALIPQNSYNRVFRNYRHNSENRHKTNGGGFQLYSKIITIPKPNWLPLLPPRAIHSNFGVLVHPTVKKKTSLEATHSYHGCDVSSIVEPWVHDRKLAAPSDRTNTTETQLSCENFIEHAITCPATRF